MGVAHAKPSEAKWFCSFAAMINNAGQIFVCFSGEEYFLLTDILFQ